MKELAPQGLREQAAGPGELHPGGGGRPRGPLRAPSSQRRREAARCKAPGETLRPPPPSGLTATELPSGFKTRPGQAGAGRPRNWQKTKAAGNKAPGPEPPLQGAAAGSQPRSLPEARTGGGQGVPPGQGWGVLVSDAKAPAPLTLV